MGITKISNLFAANVDAVPAVTPSKGVTAQADPAQSSAQPSSDAVIVAKTINVAHRSALQDAESARAAKVEQLRQQVKSGAYKVDRDQVAISILRDLA